MRILLACLMCELLVASQCLAIDGGPVYGTSQVTTTGTYAGVFIPREIVVDPGPPPVTTKDNSLGLFTTVVPRNGLATGTVGIFRNGFFYPGTIQAVADPDSAKLTGVVNATFNITFATVTSGGDTTTFVVTYNGNGSLKSRIVPNPNQNSTSPVRVRGDAELTYNTIGSADPAGNSGIPISYKVRGFKQSEASG